MPFATTPAERAATVRTVLSRLTFEFDESKITRDERGRFGEKDGGGDGPVEVAVKPQPVSDNPFRTVEHVSEAAWRAIATDEAKALGSKTEAARTFPERYEEVRSGRFELKVGETAVRLDESSAGKPPVLFDVRAIPPSEALQAVKDGTLIPSGDPSHPIVRVEGSERPPESLYRIMDVAEYDQARERGYFKSDERQNLVTGEGTVVSLRPTGTFYAPSDGSDYRIVRFDYHESDGWLLGTDTYVKTDEQIPFDHAAAVTPPIVSDKVLREAKTAARFREVFARIAVFEFDESKHPRDEKGRFGEDDGAPTEVKVEPSTKTETVADPAWRAITTPEAKALDDPKGVHPERYVEGKFGLGSLKAGEIETRAVPATGGPPRLHDVTPNPGGYTDVPRERLIGEYGEGMLPLVSVENSERPPEAVYRVMALGEYDQARERGYFQSDERMNLGPEGTVASLTSTGGFYAPLDGSDYRIVRLEYRDEDGWKHDPADQYVKTPDRIPFERVEAVTTPISQQERRR